MSDSMMSVHTIFALMESKNLKPLLLVLTDVSKAKPINSILKKV